ncbi:MAG: LuxR C-terminal-related transcriptional regulator [Burkholderiales bacterium]
MYAKDGHAEDRAHPLREPLAAGREALAARRALARFRAWLAADGWHEIEVAADMRIRHAARGGLALLGAAVGRDGLRCGARVPAEIDAWLRRSGPGAPAGAARRVVHGSRHIVLRALPAIDGDGWLLYVGEQAAPAAVPTPGAGSCESGLLSPREREVLDWVGAGKTDLQAAAILGISVRTVQKHLEHVYVKLGVEGRTAAVMRVRAAGPAR